MPKRPPPEARAIGAALFLLAKEFVPNWGGWPKTEAEILLLAGAKKRDAHEARSELRDLLLDLEARLGFQVPEDDPFFVALEEVAKALVVYGGTNPDAVRDLSGTLHYSDDFCRFVVGLRAPGQPGEGLTLDDLAFSVGMPVSVLEDWSRSVEPDSG